MFAQTALEDCGITDEDQETISLAINQMPGITGTTQLLSAPYDIPLHVYIFRSSEGVSPHPGGFDLGAVQMGVDIANASFPDEMNFYICKVDIIENTTLHNTSGFRNINAFYN